MKLTNKHNLPAPLVSAIEAGEYKREGIHVSSLVDSPRIRVLRMRHWDEIVEDVANKIWVLLGRSVHAILEKADTSDALQEEELKVKVNGHYLIGSPDLLHGTNLTDYKITSAWSVIYEPEGKETWQAQVNVYRWLYQQYGFRVEKGEIVTILRDWQRSKAKQDHNYPQIPVKVIPIKLMPDEVIENYIQTRMDLHVEAESLPDDKLPLCTVEEMWQSQTKYAVMKNGRKRAVRVCDSQKEAEQIITESPNGLSIEIRKGENKRCADYCEVNRWCNQYQLTEG